MKRESRPGSPYLLSVTLLLVISSVLCLSYPAGAESFAPSKQMQAYYDWTSDCIAGVGRDIPSWTEWVDKAAKLYVEDPESIIAAVGDGGFTSELGGRSGGIMRLRGSLGKTPPTKIIVLYVIREDNLDKAVAEMTPLTEQGAIVVAFARRAVLDKALAAGAKWSTAVDTHAAPNGGLFKDRKGKWVVPTDSTAAAVASWTWTAEFAGACSRLGKMPVFYEGYAVPGGQEWAKKVNVSKFHEEAPFQAAAGRYGRDFLRNLQKDVDAVFFKGEAGIRKVARLSSENLKKGKGSYAFLHGHCLMRHSGYPGDPGFFTQVNDGWFKQKKEITLHKGDLVFCVGFDQIFQGWQFETWTEDARKAGAVLAWSITDYNENPECGAQLIAPEEIFISQRWSFGDAVVNVPMYPINICPTSGVLAEFVFWTTNAAVLGLQSR